MIYRRLAWLAPLAAVLAAGCFATRNDVRLLQADVTRLAATAEENRRADTERLRLEMARRDSMHATDMKQVMTMNRVLSDSVSALSDLVIRFKASTLQSLRESDERQLTMMDILGASQKTIAEMRQRVEAQREERAAPVGSAADSAGAATPGPFKMYRIGMDQMASGATGGARSTFRDFLDLYKTDTLVAEVLYQVGYSYTMDKMDAQADSIYQQVVERFPKSAKAPYALFKRAEALSSTKPKEARILYTRVINEYPKSDLVGLARERQKTLPPS